MLGRARRLAARTLEVASAAAVIGRSFGFDLLTAITDAGPDEVAAALRELQDAYFVLPGSDAVSFDFRHALIRDSLYADTDLPVRRRLHERVALTAAERGYRGAFISAHFEQAGCRGPAYEHAAAAASEAASMSAHGEALELYRRAVRNLPAGLAVLDRAALFAALGDEAAATDDNTAAAQAYRAAHELAAGAGDVRRRRRWRRAWPRSRTCSARTSMPAWARCKRRWTTWTQWPTRIGSGHGCAAPWPLPTCWMTAWTRPSPTGSSAGLKASGSVTRGRPQRHRNTRIGAGLHRPDG